MLFSAHNTIFAYNLILEVESAKSEDSGILIAGVY